MRMSCVYGVIVFNVYRGMEHLSLCPVCKDVSIEMIQIPAGTIEVEVMLPNPQLIAIPESRCEQAP